MLRIRLQYALAFAVVGPIWLPAASLAKNTQVQEQTAAVAPSEPSAALAQIPSGQLVVTYENGELTIKARNARLSDILRKICDKTGAVLDALSVDEEGVFADLGPGPARGVLASLLENSEFNYEMVGSAGDPNGVGRVVVFARSKNGNAENQPPLDSTLAASNGQKPRQQQLKTNPLLGTVQVDQNARNADSVANMKDANAANMLSQMEALAKAVAAGETVDDSQLQVLLQQASDASSSSPSSPGVGSSDPLVAGDPLAPSRPRHRRH